MYPYGLASKANAHPGKREDLLQVLVEISRLVFHAEGCQSYVVSTLVAEADAVFITEYWASQEAQRSAFALPGIFELINDCQTLSIGFEQVELQPLNS